MKKWYLLALMLMVMQAGLCQERGDVKFSVHYIAHFKLYAEAQNEITEERVLDVGDGYSCFYGRWQQKRQDIMDSVMAAGGNRNQAMVLAMDYPIPCQYYYIYNNYPAAGKRTVTDQIIKSFYYEEAIDPIQWTILDRDTTVMGYPCEMATCEYRNHRWTACYTQEIPVPLGPWKLHGLPGMILSAWDDSGVFAFEGIEIRQERRQARYPKLNNSIKCTRNDIKAMQREMYSNPEDFAKRFGATGKGTDANGRPIVYKERTALFMD